MKNAKAKIAAGLLSSAAVRNRCSLILAAADRGETRHFRLNAERLDHVAELVAAVTLSQYPTLDVPYHARYRHFQVGGVDRVPLVAPGADNAEKARACIELVIVSVLLDAGAGATWKFQEVETGKSFNRSEGLGVASFRAAEAGLFSADSSNPWRVDASALKALMSRDLAKAFQCKKGKNELLGLAGRANLLRRLGKAAQKRPEVFGTEARIGNLYDYLAREGSIKAADILGTVLDVLGPIWPKRITYGGISLGDTGRHSAIPGDGFVTFHKLSQWLSYSLVEPLENAGCVVHDLNGLTGLAEYRNGGLFIDGGVLVPVDADLPNKPLHPTTEEIVEWRALTVALLDRIAPLVRQKLGVTEADFPLAKILEGGTWAAGRKLAYERRPDGSPPLKIVSDGTWF